jgi:hypothetical protein
METKMPHALCPSPERENPTVNIEVYCGGRTNIIVTRYRFNLYNQRDDPMDTYITELRNNVASCEYDVMEDSLPRDCIVCG